MPYIPGVTETVVVKGLGFLIKSGKVQTLGHIFLSWWASHGFNYAVATALSSGFTIGTFAVTLSVAEDAKDFVQSVIDGDGLLASKKLISLIQGCQLGIDTAYDVVIATAEGSGLEVDQVEVIKKGFREAVDMAAEEARKREKKKKKKKKKK